MLIFSGTPSRKQNQKWKNTEVFLVHVSAMWRRPEVHVRVFRQQSSATCV